MNETLFHISFKELCQYEHLDQHIIIEIVEYGIVIPINNNLAQTSHDQWLFNNTDVALIHKAWRLHRDLEIDWLAIAMLLDLMEQKERLEQENAAYKRQLDRFITTS